MNTYFSEIHFRTGASHSQAIVGVQSGDGRPEALLEAYAKRHGLVLLEQPALVDEASMRMSQGFTPLHAHLSRKIGPDRPVAFLVLNKAPASACSLVRHEFDASLPVVIVFNAPRNLAQYRRLRLAHRDVVPLASFVDDTDFNLPATVGVPFPEWSNEAQELCAGLDAPLILLDPPDALKKPSHGPALQLMEEDAWSISHPLDCHWWRSAPVIDAEPRDIAGTRMFRMLRPNGGPSEPGYIGRAHFDFDLLTYPETRMDDPTCPSKRLIALACETAIANSYLEGVDYGFLAPALRRQSGIPDLKSLGSVAEVIDLLFAHADSAVHRYRVRNDNRLRYQSIEDIVSGLGLAAEKGQLETAVARWEILCGLDMKVMPLEFPASQLAAIFVSENSN
ncbi:MAG: hypothetical protein M9924_03145 [Rhizobiaceae bacterium]|nr:hypothetical protein [Rhizobiaceae bacterium]